MKYFQKYSGNTNGLWVVENLSFFKGGLVSWNDIFFLRNFASGKYLTIENKGNNSNIQLSAIHYPNVYSIF